MTHYIAILVADNGGQWRALIPDVPECEATAAGLVRAKKAAAESLVRAAQGNGGALPAPRTLAEIERDEEWLIRHSVDFDRAIVTIVPWPGDPFSAPAGHA
jgi:hypothetical protein